VVDPFMTDTARRADVVLPVPTLLEDDDVLGAYGHHWVSESRPAVEPPPGVVHEVELFQRLARRLGFGDALYALLGGQGEALAQALAYSHVLFAGAVGVWLANTLASVLRGSGNTLGPAVALAAAALVQIPLSGALTLGWGPFPRLGIAGAALAYVAAFLFASALMGAMAWRAGLAPARAHWRLEWRVFREILRVGAVSVVQALQTVATAVVLTGFVGSFGTAALAGYGVGVRLEGRFRSNSRVTRGADGQLVEDCVPGSEP